MGRRERPRQDRLTVLQPESDADRQSQEPGYSDFLVVENQRRELFPQEFAEGAYGAPDPEPEQPEHAP